MAVLLETSKGDLVVDLFTDECPLTTRNFLKLCKCVCDLKSTTAHPMVLTIAAGQHRVVSPPMTGLLSCRLKYYNNALFHNVQPNFIAQTGDPTGTGKGGDSVYGCALPAMHMQLRCCDA